MTGSLRLSGTMATFAGFPASLSRLYTGAILGLKRIVREP